MFVSDASPPVAPVQPDPNRAAPNRPVPPRIAQVLGVVRTLIAYGKNLAATLRQHAADSRVPPRFPSIATRFGTGDLVLILVRIMRGLLRAAALEARLHRRAAHGRDLNAASLRPPSPRKPCAAKPAIPPGDPPQAPSLALLPTPEQIDAEVRRRPIGAVLVDICLDLGIAPGLLDRATWDELSLVLIGHGGSLVRLLFGKDKRRSADPTEGTRSLSGRLGSVPIAGPTIGFPACPALAQQSLAPACTGPP